MPLYYYYTDNHGIWTGASFIVNGDDGPVHISVIRSTLLHNNPPLHRAESEILLITGLLIAIRFAEFQQDWSW